MTSTDLMMDLVPSDRGPYRPILPDVAYADFEARYAAFKSGVDADDPDNAPEPRPAHDGPCERCEHPDAQARVYDVARGATVCAACAAQWVAAVVDDFASSLSIFLGDASTDELQAHAERVAAAEDAERRRLADAAERKAKADAVKAARARALGRYVQQQGGRVTRLAAVEAMALTARTLSRVARDAIEAGYITSKPGARGGLFPGSVPVPEEVA